MYIFRSWGRPLKHFFFDLTIFTKFIACYKILGGGRTLRFIDFWAILAFGILESKKKKYFGNDKYRSLIDVF